MGTLSACRRLQRFIGVALLAGCGSELPALPQCQPPYLGPDSCPSAQTICNEVLVAPACGPVGWLRRCADLKTSTTDCGACGVACPWGASCSAGVCACPAGQSVCNFRCVDLLTDPTACGTCGQACGDGTCNHGACVCSSDSGTVSCGGSPLCANTTSDPKNCGTCGSACPLLNEACFGGACACPLGATPCPAASPTACVNLMTDWANCGACGAFCGGVCVGGTCQPMAPDCGKLGEPCCPTVSCHVGACSGGTCF